MIYLSNMPDIPKIQNEFKNRSETLNPEERYAKLVLQFQKTGLLESEYAPKLQKARQKLGLDDNGKIITIPTVEKPMTSEPKGQETSQAEIPQADEIVVDDQNLVRFWNSLLRPEAGRPVLKINEETRERMIEEAKNQKNSEKILALLEKGYIKFEGEKIEFTLPTFDSNSEAAEIRITLTDYTPSITTTTRGRRNTEPASCTIMVNRNILLRNIPLYGGIKSISSMEELAKLIFNYINNDNKTKIVNFLASFKESAESEGTYNDMFQGQIKSNRLADIAKNPESYAPLTLYPLNSSKPNSYHFKKASLQGRGKVNIMQIILPDGGLKEISTDGRAENILFQDKPLIFVLRKFIYEGEKSQWSLQPNSSETIHDYFDKEKEEQKRKDEEYIREAQENFRTKELPEMLNTARIIPIKSNPDNVTELRVKRSGVWETIPIVDSSVAIYPDRIDLYKYPRGNVINRNCTAYYEIEDRVFEETFTYTPPLVNDLVYKINGVKNITFEYVSTPIYHRSKLPQTTYDQRYDKPD